MKIEMNEALLVGYAPIDDEHRALLGLVNAFFVLVESGADRQTVYDAVDGLSVNFAIHCEHEKGWMLAHRYPDTANHLDDHVKLIGELGAMLYRMDEACDDALAEVAKFIENWFADHVKHGDRPLGKFLKERAVKTGV
ncbi:MAG: hemerythrin domain-containing protein [Rhodospirillaceae bacterium]